MAFLRIFREISSTALVTVAAGVSYGSRSCIHPRAGVKFLHTSHTSTAALQHLHPADSCLQMLPWIRLLHKKACVSLS